MLAPGQLAELATVIRSRAPEGDVWIGRTVADWMSQKLGRPDSVQLGWAYLVRLDGKRRKPRPRHVKADPASQEAFKKTSDRLVQAVATAFPKAQVELWTMNEHRIGLKPILQKVWCFDGERPIAPVQHRYDWRYLVSFVHPASGRSIFHLATSVNLDLFAVELDAFARAVGAGPKKQIVLVLDRAGWHASLKLRVPEHVHLLFCQRSLRSSSQRSICGP